MVPLFPLPNVVLFPGVYLPLHIFEPRYRDMVRDALRGDRLIGMVLLREGGDDPGTAGNPPVYPTGCTGLITNCAELSDGRYNIVLRGQYKFRILDEDHTLRYRRARVERVAEPHDEAGICAGRQRLERLLQRTASRFKLPEGLCDADVVNALSQYLEFEPVEKQALLESASLAERCRALGDLLEMQSLAANTNGRAH